MSAPVDPDLNSFTEAIDPLIKVYDLEQTEQLRLVIQSCFHRWKEIHTKKENVQEILGELILFIKENFGDDRRADVLGHLCEKIGIRLNEIQRKLGQHEDELKTLQRSNISLADDNDQLRTEIIKVNDRMDISESYNFAYDLIRLFIFYHISPVLKCLDYYKDNFKTWTLFSENLTMLKRQLRDGHVESSVVTAFVKPLQDRLNELHVDVSSLHEMIQNRNLINHRRIRSTLEQEAFIEEVSQYQFTPKFLYADLTKTVLNILTKTSLKRYVN